MTVFNRLLYVIESGKKQYYVRFGEIPKDGRSGIGNVPTLYHNKSKIGTKERGVSVYQATWNETKKWWELDIPRADDTTSNELIELARTNQRKIYLVSGRRVGYGTDNEPLLRDLKIVKQLTLKDIYISNRHDPKEDQRDKFIEECEMRVDAWLKKNGFPETAPPHSKARSEFLKDLYQRLCPELKDA